MRRLFSAATLLGVSLVVGCSSSTPPAKTTTPPDKAIPVKDAGKASTPAEKPAPPPP